jgi:hypothetical protein
VFHYVAFLSPDYVIGIVRHGRNGWLVKPGDVTGIG